MALILCSECGNSISDNAVSCDKCGCLIDIELHNAAIKISGIAADNLKKYKELAASLLVIADDRVDVIEIDGSRQDKSQAASNALNEAKQFIKKYDGHTVLFVAQSNYESDDMSMFSVTASNKDNILTYIILYNKPHGTNDEIITHKPILYDKVLNNWIGLVWK